MTKFGKLITAFLILLVLAGGAMFFIKKDLTDKKSNLPEFNFGGIFKEASGADGKPAFVGEYINPEFGFSISHPDEFEFNEIDEDQGLTIFAEGGGNKSFQIFIHSFDEPGPITPQRIKKDLPEMNILQSQTFSLNGVDALAFQTDANLEVWFVRDGYLYQVTSPKKFTDELSKILATWKFENI